MINRLRRRVLGTTRPLANLPLLVVLCMSGCGGFEEQAEPPPATSAQTRAPQAAPPQVDPRFFTAEALLEHYNELAMASPTVDMRRLMELYYAETVLQRRLIEFQTSLIPLMEYDLALWDQFGEGMTPKQDTPRLAPNREPAGITSQSGDRVTAEYTDRLGKPRTLDLILVNGGWWISGRSLAQDPQHPDLLAWMDQWEGVVPNASVVPLVTERVRNGEFESAPEAEAALESVIRDRFPVKMATVAIEGATFTMGTPLRKGHREYHPDEAPLTVTVDDFRIGKYPVTAEQMCEFLNSPEAKEHGHEDLYNRKKIPPYRFSTVLFTDDGQYVTREGMGQAPANQVTWKGAALFCRWLSERTGRKYRLPTEAEWELAAGGEESRKWPWGGTFPGRQHGTRYAPGVQYPPVGSHPANVTPEGVHDMLSYYIGEWCANKYVPQPTPDQANSTEADLDDLESPRVIRGYILRFDSRPSRIPLMGADHYGRPWTRMAFHPIRAVEGDARYGFRVVEEVEESKEDPS